MHQPRYNRPTVKLGLVRPVVILWDPVSLHSNWENLRRPQCWFNILEVWESLILFPRILYRDNGKHVKYHFLRLRIVILPIYRNSYRMDDCFRKFFSNFYSTFYILYHLCHNVSFTFDICNLWNIIVNCINSILNLIIKFPY